MTIHDRMLIDIIFDSRLRQVFHMRYVSAGPAFPRSAQQILSLRLSFADCV